MTGFLFSGGSGGGSSVLATGSTTARTTEDRFAEVTNVKDYGARGDGLTTPTDDSAAIQGAVNAMGGSGVLFFPPGTYIINTTVDLKSAFNIYLTIRGSGAHNTVLKSNSGSLTGYVLDYNHAPGGGSQSFLMEGLTIENTNVTGGGCFRFTSGDSGEIRNCLIFGFKGLYLAGTSPNELFAAVLVHNCVIYFPPVTGASGSFGIANGPHTTIEACSIVGFDNAIRQWGIGQSIICCRIENNILGLRWGVDAAGATYGVTAAGVHNTTFEGNGTGIRVVSATNSNISFCSMAYAAQGPPNGATGSSYGLIVDSCDSLVVFGSNASGAFITAGFHIAGAVSKLRFISSDAGSFTKIGGVNLGTISQMWCKNFGSFGTTFANLPGQASNASETPMQGERRLITDCNTSTYNAAAAGSGSTTIFVTYNGSAWVVG